MNFQVEKTKLKHPGAMSQFSVFQFNCDVTFLQCNSALGRLQNRFTLKTLFPGHLDLLRVTKPNKD